MSRRQSPPPRRDESEEEYFHNESSSSEDQTGEHRTLYPQPLAKSFHTTISKDWTDQEALEGQRLVALQEKSELNTPLGSVQNPPSIRACIIKFKQILSISLIR